MFIYDVSRGSQPFLKKSTEEDSSPPSSFHRHSHPPPSVTFCSRHRRAATPPVSVQAELRSTAPPLLPFFLRTATPPSTASLHRGFSAQQSPVLRSYSPPRHFFCSSPVGNHRRPSSAQFLFPLQFRFSRANVHYTNSFISTAGREEKRKGGENSPGL
ncbi:hypothetical protein POM88_030882 [Heracleum sosnowskyi]|uniref:Uncharacterized protein n=1 Tax=Heracleum sosnowskyi TaxID=360622 RepID=A0AAD8MJ76_9APIA|nr:hypothetical protein POM88_030882 [Heracleum sosnowskyi]